MVERYHRYASVFKEVALGGEIGEAISATNNLTAPKKIQKIYIYNWFSLELELLYCYPQEGDKMETILIYVVMLALFAGIPITFDIYMAYRALNKTQKQVIEKLIENASFDKLELQELQEFIKVAGKAPPGIPGLARAMMALTVIFILGVAVFHVLVKGVPGGDSSIVNNILSMLAGLLAAITGFYFGGKAAEEKKKE